MCKAVKTTATALVLMAAVSWLAACGKQATPPAKGAPEVAVFIVKPAPLAVTTELPGRTSAFQIAEVRPQVGGIVRQRAFQEGADVKAGQVLYEIDPASYQAAYESAKAGVAKAEASAQTARLKADRFRDLVAVNAVSKQDADDAIATQKLTEAEVAASKAVLEAARINLGYTRITAPIAGRVGKSSVTPGALLTANQANALTTVQQLDPMYVDIPQSSTELLSLRRALAAGQLKAAGAGAAKVTLLLEDGTPYALEGKLAFTDVTVDAGTGAVLLRAVFPNPKHDLLPGMYVRAVLQQGVNEQALLVPQQGVTRNSKGEATALVLGEDGKVVQRILSVGDAIGNQWLVRDGLKAGDKLIVEGLQKVKPGVTANVAAADAAQPAAAK
jgi:membrane fusion protein (multidrug efflux system)